MPEQEGAHQHHDGMAMSPKLEKANPVVNYRAVDPATPADEDGDQDMCGGCRFFDAMCSLCSLVEGSISATWGCDLYADPLPMVMPLPAMAGGPVQEVWDYKEAYQLFVEAPSSLFKAADLSKPGWIPFLPKPGTFNHPLYGEIVITPEQNQQMVDSVRNHVYQEHIPLDAEHETKLSGAVAWIKDMRLNEDGSADAFVEWTDRGRQLVEGGQFKYISPEWFDSWRDPGTGVVHRNVVAGGAITTRPFFKDKVLRALVASEDGATIIKQEEQMPGPIKTDPEPTPDPTPEPTFTAAEVQAKIDEALAEATKKATEEGATSFAELNTRLLAAEASAASEKAAREELAKNLIAVQNRERNKRFTELVAGKGGANDGGAWVGDAEKHVAFMEKLADQVGETDEMFVQYVEQQNAAAAQIREAGLFSEAGSSASAGGSDPEAKLETMARSLMAADPKLTHAKAYTEALATPEGAKLYQESILPRK